MVRRLRLSLKSFAVPSVTLRTLLPPIMLLCAIGIAQVVFFTNRDYRQEEARNILTLLSGLENNGLIRQIIAHITQAQGNVFQTVYVALLGDSTLRYLSLLVLLPGLAAMYRLVCDWFDRQSGLLTLFTLLCMPVFMVYSHEALNAAWLVSSVMLVQWLWLRCLNSGKWQYAWAIIIVVFIASFLHIHIVYSIVANLVLFAMLRLWGKIRYPRAYIWLLVAFAVCVPRLLTVSNAAPLEREIAYNVESYKNGTPAPMPEGADRNEYLLFLLVLPPVTLGYLLIAAVPFIPAKTLLQHAKASPYVYNSGAKKWFFILLPIALALLTVAGTSSLLSFTSRNLVFILPFMSLLYALILRTLDVPLRIGMVAIMLGQFFFAFTPPIHTGEYQRLADYVSNANAPADSPIVIQARDFWEHIPLFYALKYRSNQPILDENVLHIAANGQPSQSNSPLAAHRFVWDTGADMEAQLTDFWRTADTLWLIEGNSWQNTDALRAFIHTVYMPIQARQEYWENRDNIPVAVTEYRRIPDTLTTLYGMGDQFELQAWSIRQPATIAPCASFTVQTWWRTQKEENKNYSLTVVLADDNGQGVTRNDGFPSFTPTGAWTTSGLYVDERSLPIPCDIVSGKYHLLVGIYDYETGESLPLDDGSGLGYLTTFEIQAGS